MDAEANPRDGASMIPEARAFLRDFASYSGRKAAVTTGLIVLSALLEGITLAFLVPLLGIVIGSGLPAGWMERGVNAVLQQFFHAERPFEKLTVILALFGALIVVRAVVISLRDTRVAELQIGFVEAKRARVAALLAAAPWDQLVGLRHARITHLMSGDVQRVGSGAYVLLQGGVAAATLLAQCALVFILTPAMGLVAVALLAISGIILVPITRRAYRLGGIVTNANLSLLNSTAQFLGG